MAPFILKPYLSETQLELWIALSEVHYIVYSHISHFKTCSIIFSLILNQSCQKAHACLHAMDPIS